MPIGKSVRRVKKS